MLRIGDEDDLRAPGTDVHRLADHAVIIEDGLARGDSVDRAAVDEHPLAQAVELDVDDFGGQPAAGHRRQRLSQADQRGVLLRQRVIAHGAHLEIAKLGPQEPVLGLERVARGEAAPYPVPGRDRRAHGELDGVGRCLHDRVRALEPVEALIEDHEGDREDRVQGETEAGGASAPLQRSTGPCCEARHLAFERSRRYSSPKWPGPISSISSRMRPPPRATQVRGSSATTTGSPVSSVRSLSMSRSNAPPPVSTMPRSATSAPSSGGVCSSACLTALTMFCSGSCSASRISLLFSVKLRGTPSERLRPLTESSRTCCPGYAEPISILMRSAVASPIRMPSLR